MEGKTMTKETIRLYKGLRKVNPTMEATRAIKQARNWEGLKVRFYIDDKEDAITTANNKLKRMNSHWYDGKPIMGSLKNDLIKMNNK